MSETLIREIDCILCEDSFTPVIAPEDGENGYFITCSSPKCSNAVFLSAGDPVRTAFRAVFGIRGEALALAVEEALADCPCGSRFTHDAGKRCPECIEKIQFERRGKSTFGGGQNQHLLWNSESLARHEQKLIGYVINQSESNESLNELIEKYESGEISPEEYLDRLDLLQNRESVLLSILKAWAIALGPENVFLAAQDLDLVEQFGSRVLVTLASGVNIGTGLSILTILTREAPNWDGAVQRDLRNYINKIAGK